MDPFIPDFFFGASAFALSVERFSRIRILRYNIFVYTPATLQLIILHHLSLTIVGLLFCLDMFKRNTRVDANTYMTGFSKILYRHGFSLLVSEEMSSLLPDVYCGFLAFRQSRPSNLVREKTIVSDHCTSLLALVRHDWNCMSLLSNIVHLLSM